ncbi:MAG: aldo/keto reductase [Acetobacteraceae bacterium]|nr:aldo/keto reductase [Acetobacteraceae bacterium]
MSRFAPPGPLGMGGAPLGNLLSVVPEDDARAALRTAWDAGIRYYDTAPVYGYGLSEHRMGELLRDKDRESFCLSSKVGRLLVPTPSLPRSREKYVGALQFRMRYEYSEKATWLSIEQSLHRLGLPSVDIAFIHDVGEDTHGNAWRTQFDDAMAGAAKALTQMRREGIIKAWGLGVNRVDPCLLALEAADPDIFLVAGRYTLLDHTALDGLFEACARRGARVVTGGPYNSGLLAGGDTFNYVKAAPELVATVGKLNAVCRHFGVDLKAAALQFIAAHPVVAAVIPGGRTAAEVKENAAMMTAKIPGELWAAMRAEKLIPENAPTPGNM